jgi:hypothetical protein
MNILKNHTTEIPFKLPEHRENSGLKPPQIYERVKSWGWRMFSENGASNGNWHLANNCRECEEQALEAMKKEHLIFAGFTVFDGNGNKKDKNGDKKWEEAKTEVLNYLENRFKS